MPFIIIKGTFRPESGIPDGDTIRFLPDDPAPLYELPLLGYALHPSKVSCTIALRYEGIDALERSAREPFASNATERNRKLLSVPNENDNSRGYILTRLIGPYGRPICFVFAGEAPEDNGDSVYLDIERMQESVNYRLIEDGMVYPLFYDTLFSDLRQSIAEAAVSAREGAVGFWPNDQTADGVTWNGPSSLPNLDPIFPKLWRRLKKYAEDDDFHEEVDRLDSFLNFLRLKQDRLFISASLCVSVGSLSLSPAATKQ